MSPQVCRWPSTSTGPTDLRVLRQWRCGKPFTYLYCNTPENQPSTWRWMVGILVSSLGWPIFRGELLVLGRVMFNLLISKELLLLSWVSFSPVFVQWTWTYILVKHHSSLTSFKLCEGMAVLLMSNICPPWGFCVQQNQESSICGMRKYFIDSRYVTSLLFYSILNTIKRPKWIPQANHSQPVTPNP